MVWHEQIVVAHFPITDCYLHLCKRLPYALYFLEGFRVVVG